eukprot:6440736-Pyramimonas_sp.AAC.1
MVGAVASEATEREGRWRLTVCVGASRPWLWYSHNGPYQSMMDRMDASNSCFPGSAVACQRPALLEHPDMDAHTKGLLLALSSSIFIGSSFIIKKKGLKKAAKTGICA